MVRGSRDSQCSPLLSSRPFPGVAGGGGSPASPAGRKQRDSFASPLWGRHQLPSNWELYSNWEPCPVVSLQWCLLHKAVRVNGKCKADHMTILLKTHRGLPSHLGKTRALTPAYSHPEGHLSDFPSLHAPVTPLLNSEGSLCLGAFKLSISSALNVLSPGFHMASSSSAFRPRPYSFPFSRPNALVYKAHYSSHIIFSNILTESSPRRRPDTILFTCLLLWLLLLTPPPILCE